MVNICDIVTDSRDKIFPLTYQFFCKNTDMVYTPEQVLEKMLETNLPFLLALEIYFEEKQ